MKKALVLLFLLIFGMVGSASAITTVAGYDFEDNAFADSLISSSGAYTASGGTLESVITDSNLNTYAFSWTPSAYLELGFTDNYLVNGSGYDLALFELGVPDTFQFSLTVGGTTLDYSTSNTGYQGAGYTVNAALIDLDDFGVTSGAYLSSIVLGMSYTTGSTVPSLAVVGALNSANIAPVPEPATLLLLGSGLAGLAFYRRKRK